MTPKAKAAPDDRKPDKSDPPKQAGPASSERIVQLIQLHLIEAGRQRAALLAAKHKADVGGIRDAVIELKNTVLVLEKLADLTDDEDRASVARQVAAHLKADIVKASGQADRLFDAEHGALAQVIEYDGTSMTPEETVARAKRVAPPGLCDDEELQNPQSYACPLDKPQRETTRQVVANKLTTVAADWKDAIRASELDDRFAALSSGGLHPLVGLLLDLVTGFAATHVTKAASLAIEIGHGLARTESAVKATSDHVGQVVGLGKKLADYALKEASTGPKPNVKAFFSMADAIANAWRDHAADDVRQLPDPALVLVAEGLAKGSFDRGYFDEKIAALLAAFKPVASLGEVDYQLRTAELVYITSARHPARLALVMRRSWHTELRPSSTVGDIVQRARVGEARYDFERWVDRSMYGLALQHTPSPIMLHDTDARWATPPTGHWLHPEADTTMLGLSNRQEPAR
jgi:hypothetical protein